MDKSQKQVEELIEYINKLSVKYSEIKELIQPFSEDFMDGGEPDVSWLEKVRDKFFEMDELFHHGDPMDKYDPFA